ncbi:EAL domain-containing protein [Halopseudomonas pelagia]|uniref:EAL domain-containing protein n=1 Tax=Halopseudomonas pelagia TaxID=553151 RepID=UPI0030DB7CAA|tara:strand:+ start:46601 stop:48991 length:2391 start_codon:yes stop_codon:yes gene_type:complete
MELKTPANFWTKFSIMLVLSVLVGVFFIAILLMSSLNLKFSQAAMSELRQQQIADTFYANLNRINAHHQLMEQNTANLAHVGEILQRGSGQGNATEELAHGLRSALANMPEAYGAEIWYGNADNLQQQRSAYGYRSNAEIHIQPVENLYHVQDWYRRILPEARSENRRPATPHFYWTPAYYKELIDNVVISLTTVMRDSQGAVIGLASTDWRADEIIRLVSRVEVTPGAFAFLLDSENRNLSSLAISSDAPDAQQKIDAIINSQLHSKLTGPLPQSAIISGRLLVAPMQTMPLNINEEDHALFFSRTQAGMIFGVGVPQAEIDAVLLPMRKSNLKIVWLVSALTLGLSGIILLFVANLLNRVHILHTDTLTQLPNREKLLVDLGKANSGTLVLINIDSFKEINDFYGHQCGDHVIGQLASALQTFLDSLPAGSAGRLYRMPADELAIWLPESKNPQGLEQLISALQDVLGALAVSWIEHRIPLNMTLGVATSLQPDGSQQADGQLLTSANIALKSARRNKLSCQVYDPDQKTRESYEHNLVWANRLKKALDEGRIVPYFQPIMDLKTGRIDKFECLARMIDEDGQAISPLEFLAVAKKIRLYRYITRTMVQQCFNRFADNNYEFSLNLSCEDLLDPELMTFIVNSLEQSSIAPRVIFEILESEGIENYSAVRQFIDRVKELGCRIAIDDFGTGYSNFEHLLRLNVDIIKIDGTLVKHLDTDSVAYSVARGIQQFAAGLGMQTVAEYVHSPAILDKVQSLNIDFAQGYHVGKPLATLVTDSDNSLVSAQVLRFNSRR